MNNTVIGIDIAKNVFQVCVMKESGSITINRRLPRSQVLEFISKLPNYTVALESCGGSSY